MSRAPFSPIGPDFPRAETPTYYIAMAMDPDLTVATTTAIQEMVDFLVDLAERGANVARGSIGSFSVSNVVTGHPG